jgi:hypothetical protein
MEPTLVTKPSGEENRILPDATPMSDAPRDEINSLPKPLTPDAVAEIYDRIRKKIEHEDTLVSQRLSWLLTSQGFLFVAFGLLLNAPAADSKHLVIAGLSILGIITSLLTLQGVVCASNAITDAFVWWMETTKHPETDTSPFPPLIGRTRWFSDSRATSWGTPIVTLSIWLVMLIWTAAK